MMFYVILNLSLGRSYGVKTTLLAFTGWSSIAEYKYLFVVISFAATVAFAAVFDQCTEKLDTLIYGKKKI